MVRTKVLWPLSLGLLTALGTGLVACEPGVPSGSQEASPSTTVVSPDPAVSEEPTLVIPTVKPGSTERPILTVEPPPPVVP